MEDFNSKAGKQYSYVLGKGHVDFLHVDLAVTFFILKERGYIKRKSIIVMNMEKSEFIKKTLSGIAFAALIMAFLYIYSPGQRQSIKMEVISSVSSDNMALKVLIDGEIREMAFEEYIMHVVAGEMYADYDIEALKAQAVTARTYTYYKLQNGGCGNGGADICSDINHCQAYAKNIPKANRDKMSNAVYSTMGEIITYEGKPIIALFHSTSGGMTEDNVNVFGQDLPYLKSVISTGEEQSPRYSQKEVRKISEIKDKAKASGSTIEITARLASGRVREVNVFGKTMTGKELRELLDLSSANFDIHVEDESVVFTTTGYGHGVGLSQVGANAMAKEGYAYKDIIKHYYTGVEISKISK